MGADTITVNGQTVAVPTSPINSGATLSSLLRPRVRVEDDRLILELDRGMRPFGVLILAWGLAAASVGVVAVVQGWDPIAKLVFIGQGAILPLIGLALVLLPSRPEFDRREGVYRRRSAFAADVHPLEDIVGVQTIRGRVVETDDEGGRSRRQTYELNLVIAGGSRRLAVTCMADDGWVAEAGRAVSEFLGVPLLGRLTTEPGADPDRRDTSAIRSS